MKRLLIVLLCMVTWLSACTDEFKYSSHRCFLFIDNSLHQDATLAEAMNVMSKGIFCIISSDEVNKRFVFTSSTGLSSTKNFTAKDQQLTRVVGFNNGVIVGYGTLTSEFYAYDRECPDCFEPDAIPVRSRPLTVNNNGTASCALCKRIFSLDNGGNCISDGGGRNMTRYRCNTPQPYGVLNINN